MTVVLAVLLLSAQLAATAPDLADGIRAVREGDFEAAVLALDSAARRLAEEPGRAAQLDQAFLYLGVAYLGLGQEGLARAKFRDALARNPKLEPGPQELSRKALRVFDEARREVVSGKAIEREARRGMGKKPWLLLGAGVAGAAGAAVVLGKDRANTPPTASFTVTPEGVAIVGVTDLVFRATATDAEGDPLMYQWQFGDGGREEGAIVAHRYKGAANFTVTLSVSDGVDTTDVAQHVSVASLTGRWRTTSGTFPGLLGVQISQGASSFDAEALTSGWDPVAGASGMLVAPRYVSWRMRISVPGHPEEWIHFNFLGEADAPVQRLTGTLYCSGEARSFCPAWDWPETFVRE